MNYDATAPTIGVCIANGTPVHSIASGELAFVTALPQPAERAMSWRASHIHSLDWLLLLMLVAECSLQTQPSLHLIGMARLFWKVGAGPPAPNFGAGRSSHKNHRRPTCPKHNSSLGLAHMASNWKPSMQYTPFPTKADKHRIPAFNNIMTHLTARGLSVDLNIRDNEASADFKRVITETWRAKFQLVPPDMHRRNKAERMICHFKNHC